VPPHCPFCSVPAERVVLDDGSVFAIRDAFPVSAGHTLVIPRRHVATWFDATPDEQHAITAAIARVKASLDAELEPPPDGYNVGWNVGEAAGQTVMHLHVHVIPRWRGDHPSPRGGVRAVIPGKADYAADAATLAEGPRPGAADLTHGPARPLLPWLLADLAGATQVDIAVAFVWPRGVERIFAHLADCLDRGGRLRFLTGDYGDTTDPAALRHLLDLRLRAPERAHLRVFETARSNTTFHPKAYLLSSTGPGAEAVAYVGSSNLSIPALEDGVEWNVRLCDRTAVHRAQSAFDALFSHPATCEIDDAWIDAYVRRRRVAPAVARPAPLDVEPEPAAKPPEPHEIQREALAALQATRAEGNRAGLVVLATGLGNASSRGVSSCRVRRVTAPLVHGSSNPRTRATFTATMASSEASSRRNALVSRPAGSLP
jgi:diadenosine tetraphosphate (Ap4A) HIT family hydrolase/HKD family nuclease